MRTKIKEVIIYEFQILICISIVPVPPKKNVGSVNFYWKKKKYKEVI